MSNEYKEQGSAGSRDTLSDLKRFIIVVIVLFIPFLQERATYQASIEQEIVGNRMVMTVEGGKMVMEGAKGFYNLIMDDLGIYRFLKTTLVDNGQDNDVITKMARTLLVVSDRIVENTPLLVYQIGFRLGVAAYWLVLLSPFIAGAIYSGTQYWRKAQDEPRAPKVERTMIYQTVAKFSIWGFVIYLLVPTAGAAEWARYLTPGGFLLTTLMVNKLIAGYHRMV